MIKSTSVIIDTSVFLSALITPFGTAGQALIRAFEDGEVLFCQETYEELEAKLTSPKFSKVLPSETAQKLLNEYSEAGTCVTLRTFVQESRDPNDDMFLALALDGEADVIVTLDKDLLTMHPWRGVDILKPAGFLAAY